MMVGSVRKHVKQAVPAYIILLLIVIFAAVMSPSFRRVGNVRNIITQSTVLAIIAIAQSSVLFLGGIDMSVSSVISISTIFVAMFSYGSVFGLIGSILLAVAVGCITGLVNGIGIVRFRIPPMIITIATQAILKGIALILMPSSGGRVNEAFSSFIKSRIGVFTYGSIIAILLYVVFYVIYHYTVYGRQVYAIGNSELYSAQSGIPVERTIVLTYVLSGALAAIGGVILSTRISTGNPLVGDSYAMDSVAAAVVGGISMNGGVGTVFGALAGSVIMTLINNVINQLRISPYYQYITKGLVLVISLLIFQLKRRKHA